MPTKSPNPVHATPKDLLAAISKSKKAQATWALVTPLAKNEWSCWVMSAKQEATRARRIAITCDKLEKGDRRPCCWPGCPHR